MISWELIAKHREHYIRQGEYLIGDALGKLMVSAMSVQERTAYTIIRANPWISTADLGRKMQLSNQHAWEICDRLNRIHLLNYRQATSKIKTWHVQ